MLRYNLGRKYKLFLLNFFSKKSLMPKTIAIFFWLSSIVQRNGTGNITGGLLDSIFSVDCRHFSFVKNDFIWHYHICLFDDIISFQKPFWRYLLPLHYNGSINFVLHDNENISNFSAVLSALGQFRLFSLAKCFKSYIAYEGERFVRKTNVIN